MKQDLTLQCVGMMGEGHAANNRVLFTKTHHPIPVKFSKGENHKCAAPTVNRQIVLMRNPVDSLYSCVMMNETKSHSLTVTTDLKVECKEQFDFAMEF